MALADWDISGSGSCSVINDGESMRSYITGYKSLLWNGNAGLTDCQIIADIKLGGGGGYKGGGLLLRSAVNPFQNSYRLRRYYTYQNPGSYYVEAIENGAVYELARTPATFNSNIWIRTRFRIDGQTLTVHEYYDDEWHQIILVIDTNHYHASGYAGLVGTTGGSIGSVMFDNVEILEKV